MSESVTEMGEPFLSQVQVESVKEAAKQKEEISTGQGARIAMVQPGSMVLVSGNAVLGHC